MNRLFNVNAKLIPEVEAKKFIVKLKSVGFMKKNREFLVNYMSEAGTSAAINHMKASYIKLVIGDGWSERKFADITYLIAKRKRTFSQKSYLSIGKYYKSEGVKNEVLAERLEYRRKF